MKSGFSEIPVDRGCVEEEEEKEERGEARIVVET